VKNKKNSKLRAKAHYILKTFVSIRITVLVRLFTAQSEESNLVVVDKHDHTLDLSASSKN
jgi:phosphate starvation-inducible membrane PsiE